MDGGVPASPLRTTRLKSLDAAEYDWRALVTRLTPHLGDPPPHAVAAVAVRTVPITGAIR
jgi:hypothetical protein